MSDINNTQAYMVFDSSDRSFTFFRDEFNKYENQETETGNLIGTFSYTVHQLTSEYEGMPKMYQVVIQNNNNFSISNIKIDIMINDGNNYWNTQLRTFEANDTWYTAENGIFVDENLLSDLGIQNYYHAFTVKINDQVIPVNSSEDIYHFKQYFTDFEDYTSGYPVWYNMSAIMNITFEDNIQPQTTANWFSNFEGTGIVNLNYLNTSNVIDMSQMFYYCENLTSLNVSNFNTSNVTNMSGMFAVCGSLTSLNVSNFDTSNVINMSSMFSSCRSLTSLDLSNFNTSNVTNMSNMFSVCESLTSLNVSNFDTSNVINMYQMFMSCSSIINLNLKHFNTLKVTNMGYMFERCTNLENLNICRFNTSNVTSMNQMFNRCTSLTNLNLNHFNTSNVTNMYQMFGYCNSLINLNIDSFDTNNVTSLSYMFTNCSNLTNLNLTHFDTSQVTSYYYTFYKCSSLITTLNIAKTPTSNTYMCKDAATNTGAQITLRYIDPVTSTDIDTLVNTKSNNSNVINGGQGTITNPISPKISQKIFEIEQSLPEDSTFISTTISSTENNNNFLSPVYDSTNHSIKAEVWSCDLNYQGEQITLNIKIQANDNINLIQETERAEIKILDSNKTICSKPIKYTLNS